MGEKCCGTNKTEMLEKKQESAASEGTKSYFKIQGMDCADEIAALKRTLVHPLIVNFDANLMDESVTVYHDGSLDNKEIVRLIEKAGVKVVNQVEKSFILGHKKQIILISISAFLLLVGMILEWTTELSPLYLLPLYLLSIGLSGKIVFLKALRALKAFSLDMNVLMILAVIGAIFIKEYSEAATVVFLFSLAELLEALSVSKARKAISDVLKITPKTATLVSESGSLSTVDVNDIKIDNVILIRPGENAPIDGIIVEGESSFNQAALTGESVPVEKKKGDMVLAGTINELGAIKIKVSSLFKDSRVSKIISLIENAQKQKAPSQRFVDSFAKIYTPSILVLSILVAFLVPVILNQPLNVWIYRALVLLVIGCPCALVIATPVSVVSGLTALARRGVLVKGGVYLEALGQIKAMALDKTGTITEGKPKVLQMKSFSSLDEKQILRVAASLESMTTHPLASAVMSYAKEKGVGPMPVENFKNVSGRGADGLVDGHWYFVGNHTHAHELGVCTPELEQYLSSQEVAGNTVIIVGHKIHDNCKGEILAVFTLGDQIKAGVKEAIAELHRVGINEVAMLSGDNQKTALAIAKQVGIDNAIGDLLPDDKVNKISELISKHKTVGMVGDGVNDAPALANASVGIAMGMIGSDVAIETADITLVKDDLSELPKAISQGKRVLGVIRFNIAFAILIKVVFFVLAFMGYSNLWMAVAADMGASLLVTFNALRLLKV